MQDLAGKIDAAPPRLDGILALKGVIEVRDAEESEEERRAAEAAVIAGFAEALAGLARHAPARGRGARPRCLTTRLDEIAALAARAEAAPGRKPGGDPGAARRAGRGAAGELRPLRSRPAASGSDPARHQGRHPRGARPAGRACGAGAQADRRRRRRSAAGSISSSQELNRESNTLCAKANDVELTNIGLELKSRGRAVPRAGAEPGVGHGAGGRRTTARSRGAA